LSHNNLGAAFETLGRLDEALAHHQAALAIWRELYGERHPDVATSLNNLGSLYSERGEHAQALEHYRRALNIRRELYGERHPDVASSLNNLGFAYDNLGEYAQALEYFRQSLAIRRQLHGERHPDVARCLNNLGAVHRELGEYAHALESYRRALDIRRELYGARHADVASSLSNLGLLHGELGEYAQALEHLRTALGIWREVYGEQHPDVALALNNIGGIYDEQGEFGQALEHYRRALAIRRAVYGDRHPDVAGSLNNIGEVHKSLGEYAQALECSRQALAIRREVYGERHPAVASSLNNLAGLSDARGDHARALDGYRRALSIWRAVYGERHPLVATCLDNLGAVHSELGEHAKALEHRQRALDIRRAIFGERHLAVALSLHNIADTYSRMGEHGRALACYESALDTLRIAPDGLAPPHSWPTADQLAPLPQTVNTLGGYGQALEQSLGATPGRDRLRQCLRAYQLVPEVLERVRERVVETERSKIVLGEDVSELVPRTVGIAGRLAEAEGTPDGRRAAFDAAERGSARVFLESLGRARATVVGRVDAALRAEEARRLTRVHHIDAQIDREQDRPIDARDRATVGRLLEQRQESDDQLRELIAEMERAYPQYAALKYPRPCTIEQARACLGDDEVALLYVLGSEASYLVVVTKEDDPQTAGIAVHRLAPADAIAELVAALTRPAILEDADSARELGARGYRMLLGPVADVIRGKALVVVPGGALGLLPFELLVESAGRQTDDDRFLVEGHRIRYAPSLTALHLVLLWDRTRTRPEQPLWAIGDPVYQPTDERLPAARVELAQETQYAVAKYRGGVASMAFERLPSSGVEVEQLRRLWNAPPEAIRLGPAANEAAVKAASAAGALAQYRYVHFATHGILGLADGTAPSLVLSLAGDQQGEDGFLTLGEVTGLKLNADLVVLSACQTGQGRLYHAEGVSGLARAFLYAGSRGVLCSLWRVDDAATAELMVDVYAGLKEQKPAAEALRAVQLRMIADGQPPLDWAPFILIGE
jgi:tetratricopeptide (TPR) repeat protein